MKIVFRVDSSLVIGAGHVMRCLTLAKKFRNMGADVYFIMRRQPGDLIEHCRNAYFEVSELKSSIIYEVHSKKSHYVCQDWLGAPFEIDASQTREVLENYGCVDFLIIDHYGIGYDWEVKVSGSASRIIVIDDLANRRHKCDILIDQNFVEDYKLRYKKLVPKYCTLLLGTHYCILGEEYIDHRKSIQFLARKNKKALIFFGGSDIRNVTLFVVEALLNGDFDKLELHIVLGKNYPYGDKLFEIVRRKKNIKIYRALESLAYLIGVVDFAIAAGGINTWERMVLGLPSIVITNADNQKDIAVALSNSGTIHYLGHYLGLSMENVRDGVYKLMEDQEEMNKLSQNSLNLVDGFGVDRIAYEIFKKK